MNKKIFLLLTLILIPFYSFAQITSWNNTTFVLQEEEEYSEKIKNSQFIWNNTYYAVGIEGAVISDEMLRNYLFSYIDLPSYAMQYSEIDDIYEEIQDFANGYIDDETLYCYFYDDHFNYIIFFRIILKKDKKIIVKQDATYIPIKRNY